MPALTNVLRNQPPTAQHVHELQEYVKWLRSDRFAAPTIALGTAAAEGSAETILRSDATILLFDATAPATQAIGDAAAVGTASVAARRDHKHAMPAFAAPTVALGVAASEGAAATLVRSDATILAFDATVPSTQAIGDAAATGSAAVAARRDHKHAMPAFAAPTIGLGTAAVEGVAVTLLRSDATILAFDATNPATQALGDAAAVGVATVAARRDHKHAMPSFAAPTVALGTAAVEGTAATPLRSDATIVAFDATVPTTIAPDDAAAAGSAAVAARRDHVHAIVAAAAVALTVATANAEGDATSFARSNHTHAITSSSNPGAAAAILASNASGHLQLAGLGVGATPVANAIALPNEAWVGRGASALRIIFYDTGNTVAFSHAISVPAGQAINLEGYGGDTYMYFDSAAGQINFYINGSLAGHINLATGFVND